jgi:drug/metabolite transporter (DMT)-like permease
MTGILLLITVTTLYAGYNLLVKVSAAHVPAAATTTIALTLCLQIAALFTSLVFVAVAMVRGGQVMQLNSSAYLWAAAAGLCIGGAEIAYFYLFGGMGGIKPMAANVVIPTVVCGTIAIAVVVSYFAFGEKLAPVQMVGVGCIMAGMALLYLGQSTTTG